MKLRQSFTRIEFYSSSHLNVEQFEDLHDVLKSSPVFEFVVVYREGEPQLHLDKEGGRDFLLAEYRRALLNLIGKIEKLAQG